jgi:hypothetical protein
MAMFKPTLVVLSLLARLAAFLAFHTSANTATALAVQNATKSSATGSQMPVLLELFTSQGCSSCPPADALAGKLSQRRDLVVISRPVTYWDRLGWPDTLARDENTRLQRAYAKREMANSGVYTPQIVVDGTAGAVGSREREIAQLIAAEQGKPGRLVLNSIKTANGRVVIELDRAVSGNHVVKLIALTPKAVVRIGSGENGGRIVTYFNVVKDEMAKILASGERKATLDPSKMASAPLYAVVVQKGANGDVIAASYI